MIADLQATNAAPNFAVNSKWTVVRLFEVAVIRSVRNRPELPLLSVFLNRGVIPYGDGGGQVHKPGLDRSIYQVVRRGDLVLNNQQAWRGSVGVSKYDGIISPAYIVMALRSKVLDERYADHLFPSPDMVAQYVTSSKGVGDIQRDIHTPWLRNVRVPLPSLPEQQTIARFLDWANGRLERAIRAKRKVIALLNEQKQVIIHRAVTRGLDPSVPLKPSGIPWLGDVPAHWCLTPNRALLRIRKVLVGRCHSEHQLLSLTKNGVVVRDLATGGKFSNFWERSQEVRPGDLVFCLFDVEETPRTVGLSKHFGMISGDYTVMECAEPRTAAFIDCFYRAMDDRKLLSPLYSGLRKRIPKPEFLAISTPLPPIDEQVAIVRAIEEMTSDIERTSAKLRLEVGFLVEYRTRLVADVVTGKLDVREAAMLLPSDAIIGAEETAEASGEFEAPEQEVAE